MGTCKNNFGSYETASTIVGTIPQLPSNNSNAAIWIDFRVDDLFSSIKHFIDQNLFLYLNRWGIFVLDVDLIFDGQEGISE